MRAFMAGRLELTQAEAVLAVIEAPSRAHLDSALAQLAGGLSSPIQRLRDRLMDLLAYLEAGLDFVDEHDVELIHDAELALELKQAAQEISSLARQLQARDRPAGIPRVVLVGPPNAGKSQLFNALVGSDSTLVSDIVGTTRDYVTALCECDGLRVELVDTAGVDDAVNSIEVRAQEFRIVRAAEADLIIEVHSPDTQSVVWTQPDRKRIRVWNKRDLEPCGPGLPGALSVSAINGEGLDQLRQSLANSLREHVWADVGSLTGVRCRASLDMAADAMGQASESLSLRAGHELVAMDLRRALEELGYVVGAVVTDDILDRIFQRFCIGK